MNDQSSHRHSIAERDAAIGLDPLDMQALVDARHPDPFSRLGMHRTTLGYVVRAFLPGATGVAVIEQASGACLGRLVSIHPDGLFAGFIERAAPYRLRVD